MGMTGAVHTFDNGISVFDDQIAPVQRERYSVRNVHEAEEEELFLEIIRSLEPDGLFINIGSAIGYYVMLGKRTAPGLSVHAVEPLARFRRHFLENLALNGFAREDFTIHEEAVCGSVGTATFVDRGFGSSIESGSVESGRGATHADGERKSHQLPRRLFRGIFRRLGLKRRGKLAKTKIPKITTVPDIAAVPEITTVQTITLDVLVAKIGGPVALCQMDVQGLEVDVLQGGRKTLANGSVNTFLIGTHSPALHRDCLNLLRANGYVIEFEQQETVDQPDGIIVASKGKLRLRGAARA
jgi:FkbM family methyltransferase